MAACLLDLPVESLVEVALWLDVVSFCRFVSLCKSTSSFSCILGIKQGFHSQLKASPGYHQLDPCILPKPGKQLLRSSLGLLLKTRRLRRKGPMSLSKKVVLPFERFGTLLSMCVVGYDICTAGSNEGMSHPACRIAVWSSVTLHLKQQLQVPIDGPIYALNSHGQDLLCAATGIVIVTWRRTGQDGFEPENLFRIWTEAMDPSDLIFSLLYLNDHHLVSGTSKQLTIQRGKWSSFPPPEKEDERTAIFLTPGRVNTLALSCDEKIVLMGNQRGHVEAWSLEEEVLVGIGQHKRPVWDVAELPTIEACCSASGDERLVIWDLGGARRRVGNIKMNILRNLNQDAGVVALLVVGEKILISTTSGTTKSIDTKTWEQVAVLEHTSSNRWCGNLALCGCAVVGLGPAHENSIVLMS